ncbi:hypothetical protein DXB59_12590 [Ruminococcus sp. OM05-10BH]|nr:hypothetical protein DXB59_12590 [Ruminococcus sp. OM05-10BH]
MLGGKSFVRNDKPDKAQAGMPVLYPAFFCLELQKKKTVIPGCFQGGKSALTFVRKEGNEGK